MLIEGVGGESLAAVPALDTGPVEGSSVRGNEGLSRVDWTPTGGTLRGPSHLSQSTGLTGGGSSRSEREREGAELSVLRTPDSRLY